MIAAERFKSVSIFTAFLKAKQLNSNNRDMESNSSLKSIGTG